MTTTPLKTASRVLSFATLLLAGFAIWVVGRQAFSQLDPLQSSDLVAAAEAEAQPIKPIAATESGSETNPPSKPVPHAPTKINVAQREPKKSAPVVDIFFEEEPSATDANTPRPNSADDQPRAVSRPSHNRNQATAVSTQHSAAKIPTPLKRAPAHDQEDPVSESFTLDEVDTDNTPLDPPAKPRPTNLSAQSPNHGAQPKHRSTEFFEVAPSTQADSRLLTLQRQVDQLAQAQANQSDQKQDELQKNKDLIEQLLRERDTDKLEKLKQEIEALKNKAKPEPRGPARNKSEDPFDTEPPEPAEEAAPSGSKKPAIMKAEPVDGQSEKFSIQFQDAEIGEALAMLGQLSGMNILVGRGVIGKVPTANLQEVTAAEALDAITKSLNYVYEKEGHFVFVSTAADALQRKQSNRKLVTKVFRPRYISVRDLQTLVTPLLTKPGGLIAVTNPADMGLEESRTKGGGNSLSQTDALLVVDYPEVLAQVELVIAEIDVPPSQVVIEAMILSVNLTETMKLGVNFALLGGNNKQLVTSGNGAQINGNVGFPNNPPSKTAILPAAGDFIASTAGLKYGFLTGDVAGFVEALETLADTSVVASPTVRVLNKQRAELIIGKRLGYTTTTFNGTQSIQNINFLEVGTKLVLRPYVSNDGLVRMEIHPERSDGEVVDGLPNSRTTEVTSNVMVRDGTTIVIGGLIEEQATQSTSRVPGLGALPVIGNLFKTKSNNTQRTELIVLITPRVIHETDAAAEGESTLAENERRHEQFRNKMCKIGRTSLANIEYERAARKFEEGDYDKASFHIELSLRQNRLDEDALRLKDQLDAQITERDTWFKKSRRKPPVDYHRAPSTSPSFPANGMFDQEFSSPSQTPNAPAPYQPLLIPPVPSATPDELPTPTPPAAKNNSARVIR